MKKILIILITILVSINVNAQIRFTQSENNRIQVKTGESKTLFDGTDFDVVFYNYSVADYTLRSTSYTHQSLSLGLGANKTDAIESLTNLLNLFQTLKSNIKVSINQKEYAIEKGVDAFYPYTQYLHIQTKDCGHFFLNKIELQEALNKVKSTQVIILQ